MQEKTKLTKAEVRDLVKFFSRHLVSIYYVIEGYDEDFDRVSGLIRWAASSGFIMELYGKWVYMTAGHTVNELNRAVDLDALRVCRLIDSMGCEAKFPEAQVLPYRKGLGFDWEYQESTGFDYGAIDIDGTIVEGLKKNGIVPVGEMQWKNEPEEFGRYFLLGTPIKGIETETQRGCPYPLLSAIAPAFVPVELTDNPPRVLVKPYNRIYGKVAGEIDIGCMSGGPLIGTKMFPDGRMKYWLIGVQSGWDVGTRVIAACPFAQFATAVKEIVAEGFKDS